MLDNCEHLQSFCQTLATSLLKNCPSLSLLCTSRLALALPSEQVFRCPGLSVPTLDDDNSVLSSEAVSLLLERCGQRGTSLEVNEITGPKIADLCRRLDGLPLGIEIISGAFSVLSLEVILDQLSRFLANETGMEGTSARQRTMSTAVQWSISLLPDAASELLSRLTIFQSSWTVEAASEICGFGKVRKALVYELVRNLVSHSLLFSEREPSGGVRIRMLQSTRDILLMGKKPSVQLERRFVDHFLNLAKDAEARTLKDLNQFGFEYPHIVRALELAADLSIPAWIDAALALRYFWIRVGRYNEGVGWLTRAAESLTLDPFRRGLALNAAGALSIRMADEASAKSYLEQAEICLLEKGGIDLVKVMSNLAMIDIKAGNYVAATERLERCELECTRENDTSILGLVLINLGVSYLYRDIHDDHTLEIFNRARDVARQIGNSSMEGIALGNVAETHLLRNEYGAAVETAKRMFSLGDQAVELFEFTGTIYMLSVVASRIGKPEVASVLYATGEKLAQQHNFVFHPRQSALHEETKVFLGVHQSEFKVAQKKVRNKSVSELFTIASETLDSLSQTN